MKVAPAFRVVLLQLPRGATWNTPLSPLSEHPVMDPFPAPRSLEITATWTFGSPPGCPVSTSMNLGKFPKSRVCDRSMEDELSTMKRTSILRPVPPRAEAREVVSPEDCGSQPDRATQPTTRTNAH